MHCYMCCAFYCCRQGGGCGDSQSARHSRWLGLQRVIRPHPRLQEAHAPRQGGAHTAQPGRIPGLSLLRLYVSCCSSSPECVLQCACVCSNWSGLWEGDLNVPLDGLRCHIDRDGGEVQGKSQAIPSHACQACWQQYLNAAGVATLILQSALHCCCVALQEEVAEQAEAQYRCGLAPAQAVQLLPAA